MPNIIFQTPRSPERSLVTIIVGVFMLESKSETTSQIEIAQDLLKFAEYGVCRASNAGALLTLEYIEGWTKWFEPIAAALDYFQLTEKGKEHILSIQNDSKSEPGLTIRNDPFDQIDWNGDNFNSLLFHPDRILHEISEGNAERVAKSCLGQIGYLVKLGLPIIDSARRLDEVET